MASRGGHIGFNSFKFSTKTLSKGHDFNPEISNISLTIRDISVKSASLKKAFAANAEKKFGSTSPYI